MNNRHLLRAILWATVVGILASWVSVLAIYYHYGAATAHVFPWRTDVAKVPWNTLQEWLSNRPAGNQTRMEAVGIGGFVTTSLLLLRARFVAWPLHPLGYALAGTFTLPWIWSAVFLGWLIKTLVLRYGGRRAYRKAMPFFIGIILGECVTAAFWAAYGALAGVTVYRTFPY